jgi:phosphoglycolate phosphatase-like HAD superfamily hydrolase
LVLFDIDGTLLRRAGPHHRAALVDGIRRATGLETSLDGVDTSGMLDRDLIAAMLRVSGMGQKRIRSVLRSVMAECQTAYEENCTIDLRDRVCEGVVHALRALREHGAALGVVTGNLTRIGWKKLELAGLRDFFSCGAFAEDGRTRARVAQVAMWRARRAGLAKGQSRVSLIGDHLNDIQAAKANGMQAVAVSTGLTAYEQLATASPDILIRNLTELPLERLL